MSIRNEIQQLLSDGNKVEIKFTKKNGDIRTLIAESNNEEPVSIKVFDSELKEWRTVILDSIISFNVLVE